MGSQSSKERLNVGGKGEVGDMVVCVPHSGHETRLSLKVNLSGCLAQAANFSLLLALS